MKTLIPPSKIVTSLIVIFFISLYLVSRDSHPFIGCKDKIAISSDTAAMWKYPDMSSLSNSTEDRLIRFGRQVFTQTYSFIGPDVSDSSMRYLGNNMDCQNCHFNAGTQQYVLGLVGVFNKYPMLDPRQNKVISIEQRINQCILRSMNGKRPLPENTLPMRGLAAYLKWLGSYVKTDSAIPGQGLLNVDLINRAADTTAGRILYLDNCTTCHSFQGSGTLNQPGNVFSSADSLRGYNFPPVLGPGSFNNGSGMYRLLTMTAFIYSKMPLRRSNLTLENAYDVAAYVVTRPRPEYSGLSQDYPDVKLKPADCPFPPFDDNYPAAQHKYGPYQALIKQGERK